MRMTDLLGGDLILPELRATDRDDVIRELGDFLASRYPALGAEKVTGALLAREQLGSTAVGHQLAIPHARLSAVRDLVACLARSRRGVDFDSPDDEPTRFFFVLLAPESSPGVHLKALAGASKLFKSDALRDRLTRAANAREMYDIIRSEEGR